MHFGQKTIREGAILNWTLNRMEGSGLNSSGSG